MVKNLFSEMLQIEAAAGFDLSAAEATVIPAGDKVGLITALGMSVYFCLLGTTANFRVSSRPACLSPFRRRGDSMVLCRCMHVCRLSATEHA